MAFFGCEVKPNKPFSFGVNPVKGRLHLSLATLGMGSSTNKSILQCISGDARPVFLCSLFPEKNETCQLNLEFEEADDAVFSVIGPCSIHIAGYYLHSPYHHQLKDESESYGEDIADTESEKSSDDEDYGGSFINDGEPGLYPSSSESNGKVDEKLSNPKKLGEASHRRHRKKCQLNNGVCNDEDRWQQCEDADATSGSSLLPSSLIRKSPNNAHDARHKVYVSDSDSTGSFFVSPSSLLNKKSSNNTLTNKIGHDAQNMGGVGNSGDFALQPEPKRGALDEDSRKLKKKKKEKKRRKLTTGEGAESAGQDSEKRETNNKMKRKKRRDKFGDTT